MEEEKKYTVYVHTNKINGKKYVGQTQQKPEDRWKNGSGYNRQIFYRAIEKYGWDNFEHEIVESGLTLKEANDLEERLIKVWDTRNPENGYNIALGGWNAPKSEEHKRKIGEAQLGEKNHMYGKKPSEELRQRWSDMRKGEQNGMYGRHHSDESRKKMSNSHKGKYTGADSHTARKVIRLSDKTIFGALVVAAKEEGVSRKTIAYKCKRHQGWMYLDEYEQCKMNE